MNRPRSISRVFGALLLLAAWVSATAPALAQTPDTAPISRTESLSDAVDIDLRVWQAEGPHLLLWIAPSFGFRTGHAEMAAALAARGVEVWQADFNEALFLPRGSTGMRQVDGTYVADLVERAHAATGKRIVLVSGSYGAIPVLRGAREWQARAPSTPYLIGAVLLSPNTYTGIPPLGTDPQYLPIVHATTLPLLIYQAGANGNRWQLPRLIDALREGGATVYAEILPGITGLFYEDEDRQSAAVQAQATRLPARLAGMLPLLERTPTPLQAATLPEEPRESARSLDIGLRPYQADPEPRPLRLPDADGDVHTLDMNDYRGQVTVVNFWATWCPPCVEEIPSLNRLKQAMQDRPFELISVNYAEGPETIRAFMDKVQVDFPVLIDADGSEAAKWNVLAFPSTFVIGPDGRIRYGVNAAIAWDAPEVIARLAELAAEAR